LNQTRSKLNSDYSDRLLGNIQPEGRLTWPNLIGCKALIKPMR
jgi:hypothetical protein